MTLYIVLGAILTLVGVVTVIKKWPWMNQGFGRRPVDIPRYTKYMGIVDICYGVSFLIYGLYCYLKSFESDTITFIFLITFFIFSLYGEIKFKKKN